MSAILQDELVKPMERAIWSVEHVLKFPDSRHLRYHGRDISWLDYHATFLCLSIFPAVLLYIIYRIIIAFVKCKWMSNLKRKIE